jgi:peptidoglycan/LPS O-acetylase OafA/YrhL
VQRVWGDSLAALFYYADYRTALGHGSFLGFFAQAWSLSVEEQFYIIWAVLFAIVMSRGRRRLAYWLAAGGMLLSAADRTWTVLSAHHFNDVVAGRAYYSFDTRADALLFGCLLGLLAADGYLQRWPQWAHRLLTGMAVVAAVTLVWVLFRTPVFSESTLLWWQPVSTVASAVLIAYFVLCPRSWGSRFMGLGIFVFLGEISYTIYLLHYGVYLALEPGQKGTHWSFWPTELLRLAIILGVATASWFLLEQPLSRWWRGRSAVRPADEGPMRVDAARPGGGSAPQAAGPDAPGHLTGQLGADHGQVGGMGHPDELGIGGHHPHRESGPLGDHGGHHLG